MPASIQSDPPIPTMGVMWMHRGYILGADVVEGTSVPELDLRRSLEQARARDENGGPHERPDRIHVDTEVLARKLRNVFPKIEIEVRPTPELDEAFESLAASLTGARVSPMDEFLALDEAAREPLMNAALDLFDLYPWTVHPADAYLRLDIPKCGLRDGRVTVMGQGGDSHGLMLFSSPADLDIFVAYGTGRADTSRLELPRCYSLNYAPIDPTEVGHEPEPGAAFPLPLLTVFEQNAQRPPTMTEARLLIAAIVGLTRFTKRHGHEIVGATGAPPDLSGRYRVEVLGERLEVRVRTLR